MRSGFGLVRIDLLRMKRGWLNTVIMGLVLPALWLLLVMSQSADQARAAVGATFISAFLVTTRPQALTLTEERVEGIRPLLGTTAVTPIDRLLASMVMAAIVSPLPLLLLEFAVHRFGLPLPRAAAIAGPFTLLLAGLVGCGALIGSAFDSYGATAALLNLVLTVNVALSPILYNADRVPLRLGRYVSQLPFALAVELMDQGLTTGRLITGPRTYLLLGWTLLLCWGGLAALGASSRATGRHIT